jgi:hypothetical protein
MPKVWRNISQHQDKGLVYIWHNRCFSWKWAQSGMKARLPYGSPLTLVGEGFDLRALSEWDGYSGVSLVSTSWVFVFDAMTWNLMPAFSQERSVNDYMDKGLL